ncbi:MAG: PhoH family protein [Chitinophagales bacterium]|nr:PhoH family protein [Chitinophagales bacterium]
MSKIYVLDTSAIVDDPTVLFSFTDAIIILPFVVLEELDKIKSFGNDASKNARLAIRFLDEIFVDSVISEVSNNCKIKIEFDYDNLFDDMSYGDNQIIACAKRIQSSYKKEVTIVTSDINLRVKAKSLGLMAEGGKQNFSLLDFYPYLTTINDIDLVTKFQTYRSVDVDDDKPINSFYLFEDEFGKGVGLGRKNADNKIKMVKKHTPWGLDSKNKDQACLIDLIMDKDIELVTAMGVAGSGKSLLSLACALDLVLNLKAYDRLIVYRPVQVTGNDVGFLPGTLEEKLTPFFAAIMDSFEVLFSSKNGGQWRRDLEMYIKKEKIQLEAITYIRGRSIPNSLIILDEAQNISENDIKTLLTRVGVGSKVILTGDIEQIDNKSLNYVNNGLIKIIEKFKGSKIYGHVTLTKGERSRLASEAAKLL